MRTPKRKQAKERMTDGKQLAKLHTPQDRIRFLLNGTEAPKSDADNLVEEWRTMMALVRLDEKCGSSAETDRVIFETGQNTLQAIAPALATWDADFFERVAKAMRKRQRPMNKLRLAIEQAVIAGKPSASAIARSFTKRQPQNFESVKRHVRRILRTIRSTHSA